MAIDAAARLNQNMVPAWSQRGIGAYAFSSNGGSGAGSLGVARGVNAPINRLNYDSTGAKLFGTTRHSFRFGDEAQQSEFQQLVGDRDLSAGEYYGDYAVAKLGDQNVLPGYERVGGYMARRALTPVFDEQAIRGKESPQFTEDLQVLRRRAEGPKPVEAPASAAPPQPPAPRVDASFPSLARAMQASPWNPSQEEAPQRSALQQAVDAAMGLGRDGQQAGARRQEGSAGGDRDGQARDSRRARYAGSDRWRKRIEAARQGVTERSPYPAAS